MPRAATWSAATSRGRSLPEARHDHAEGRDDVVAAPDGHGHGAGTEAHLLDGGGVAVPAHAASAGGAAAPGWVTVYGVSRGQVGRAPPTAPRPGRGPAAPCRRRSRASAAASRCVLTTGTDACRQPVEVEHLRAVAHREVHGGQRGAVQVVQERRGQLAQPGLHGREQADVPEPAADDVLARGARASAPQVDQLADQPVRGRHRQAGAGGQLGQASAGGAPRRRRRAAPGRGW